jgi:integrase
VHTLTRNDVQQYEARRKKGGIPYGEAAVTLPVRQRTVQADIKLLKQVLAWGCTVCTADGTPLLERHPLDRIGVKGEPDPRRPVASLERFEATRTAMRELQQQYAEEARTAESRGVRARAEARRCAWLRAELGLLLLEATGRRRGSVMRLRWEDFDFHTNRIRWRREYDKKRKESVVPYSASLFATIREFQVQLGAVGGPVFPRRDNPQRSAPPELLSQWIVKAETKAGLPKLEGGTTHPYRRKWKGERAHHPIKAVAVAGGWTDITTMLRCYDHPDDEDVLAVTSEPRKRRDLSIDARAEAAV